MQYFDSVFIFSLRGSFTIKCIPDKLLNAIGRYPVIRYFQQNIYHVLFMVAT